MAGQVRQPIDVASLERYVAANVPEIQVPLEVKQVCVVFGCCGLVWLLTTWLVWIRPEQSDVPVDGQDGKEVCHEEEAAGAASLKGSRYPDSSYEACP
jgi:hypothetical protein